MKLSIFILLSVFSVNASAQGLFCERSFEPSSEAKVNSESAKEWLLKTNDSVDECTFHGSSLVGWTSSLETDKDCRDQFIALSTQEASEKALQACKDSGQKHCKLESIKVSDGCNQHGGQFDWFVTCKEENGVKYSNDVVHAFVVDTSCKKRLKKQTELDAKKAQNTPRITVQVTVIENIVLKSNLNSDNSKTEAAKDWSHED